VPVGRKRRPPRRWRTEARARLGDLWHDAQWWAIGALALVALILGFVGFRDYADAVGSSTGFWDVFYLDLQLFVLESGALADSSAIPASLQIARFLAPAVASVALLRAVAPLFRDQLQLLRFRIARDHIVICGLGRKGLLLARTLRDQGDRVVVVERDEDNQHIEAARLAGVPVLVGDATDTVTLRKAHVGQARLMVAVCSGDGTNAEVAVSAHRLAQHRSRPLTCLVHVVDPDLCSLLRARYLTAPDTTPFRLDFFNTFELGAKALLVRHPPFPDQDLTPPAPTPHILVIGIGRLGAGLIVQMARNWRAADHDPDHGPRITAVDLDADEKVRSLALRHRELGEVCEITPVTLDVGSPEFRRGSYLPPDAPAVSAAYVCFDDDTLSMETSLVLHQVLRPRQVPIVMRAATEAGLPALLQRRTGAEFDDLHAFALLDRTCNADILLGGALEVIARAFHDLYVAERGGAWSYGPELDDALHTDPALAPWEELPESLRQSNRDQAAHIPVKLATIGCELGELTAWHDEPFVFTDREVEVLAELEHERWVADRVRNGWKPGRRDVAQKRTPYLVPWSELSEDVREYDRLFVRNLPRILGKLGYGIVRGTPPEL
jgi:hypothetical protein